MTRSLVLSLCACVALMACKPDSGPTEAELEKLISDKNEEGAAQLAAGKEDFAERSFQWVLDKQPDDPRANADPTRNLTRGPTRTRPAGKHEPAGSTNLTRGARGQRRPGRSCRVGIRAPGGRCLGPDPSAPGGRRLNMRGSAPGRRRLGPTPSAPGGRRLPARAGPAGARGQ